MEVDWYLVVLVADTAVEVDGYLVVGTVVEVDMYLVVGTAVEVDWYGFVQVDQRAGG